MDQKAFKRMMKQDKSHKNHCYECGKAKREGCGRDCLVQHCACFLTSGK